MRERDIFLKIELIKDYSPLAPLLCARRYGRDCMFTSGHESGRIPASEILSASLDALVYREYLDANFSVPNTKKLIDADVNEPPWNHRVPGTVLYARPGERLYIHVFNGDPNDCHSLHLHGLRYGIDSDGAWPFGVASSDGGRSDEIQPNEKWTYIFEATDETIGAWAFHDHVRDVQRNVNRGLFGGLVVRHPEAPCVNHEIPLFLHQMAGNSGVCQFESKPLGDGDTFSFTFGTTPGICHYICKIHGPMMSGEVSVVAGGPPAANVTINGLAFSPANVSVGPGGSVTWKNIDKSNGSPIIHIVYAAGGGTQNYCLNGRTCVGNTPTIVAPSGDRLRWYVFNLDLGDVWHNFHPHATRWRLPAPPAGAGDVHSLSPVESFVADTVVPQAMRLPCELEELQCDPPPDACRVRIKGDFLVHCHLEEHMMAGLAGLLRAHDYVWITQDVLRRSAVQLPYDDGSNDCPQVNLLRCRSQSQPPPPASNQPGAAGMGNTGGMSGGGMVDTTQLATKGVWETLPCNSQVLAVHAALLHTGKILFFAGSGNDPDKLAAKDMRGVVWDYEQGDFYRPQTPVDVFCAGHAFLADGKLLVAGGTERYDPFHGLRSTYLFDPILEEWIRIQDMADGRWYPSLVTLGGGQVLAVSGLSATGPPNRVPEIFTPGLNWSSLPPSADDWPTYPHLFLTQNGTIFYSGGQMGGTNVAPGLITLPANSFAAVGVPAGFEPGHRDQSFSVLLPPAQNQKVMIAGGGSPVTNKVHVIDLSVGAPAYTAVSPLHFARMHALGVLLPDRTVLITGGSVMGEDPTTAVLDPEIYDPATGTWTVVARSTVPRVYHGVALLLPDGRVITAGSNPHRKDDELRLELFHPPYLFRGPRPFIQAAPNAINYGSIIEIETPNAPNIKWVNLIRQTATTHSWDSNQRLVDVPFKSDRFCCLEAVIPIEPNVAPPGWYMLSIVDRRGIPSVAKWVHLTPKDGLIPVPVGRAAKVSEVQAGPTPQPRGQTAPTRKPRK
jgi:FtsP/CotA-like multicopper oxidase with cupredoxin domain